eukprot:TRINITY_DN2927_c0_g1_i1.p1 TRINITY_DN2927_c0_g1~~TRINITY_DN2927_c0_g1_i1.p1  ORF type:complete len:295 (+),score=44.17 TRINITY_DN2927_c0_g1_i1:45-929(+)
MSTAGWIPFVMAEMMLGWSYYVFVIRWCVITLMLSDQDRSYVEGGIEIVVFHVLFILSQISFLRTIYTEPGHIPDGFPDSVDAASRNANRSTSPHHHLKIRMEETNKRGELRQCNKCQKVKPDRAHHCSLCRRCVLKMDHHCPWVNNCIGFHNYKYFLLFLGWLVSLCLFTAGCLSKPMLLLFRADGERMADIFIFITFVMGSIFGVGLFLFACTHFVYVSKNVTTIEALEKKNRRINPYNLGTSENFRQIFGDNKILWFIPVKSTIGDGLHFPTINTYQRESEEVDLLSSSPV